MSKEKDRPDSERVSLDGLDPEEALKALLKVDPASEPVEQDKTDGERAGQKTPAKRSV